MQAAVQHAECPISFEVLHAHAVGVFLNAAGQRVSPHFFNFEAAQQWLAETEASGSPTCPVTRKPVASVLKVPSPLDGNTRAWFAACDANGDGRLSRDEVLEALKAQLPLDLRAVDRAVADGALWAEWEEAAKISGCQGGAPAAVAGGAALDDAPPPAMPPLVRQRSMTQDAAGPGSLRRSSSTSVILDAAAGQAGVVPGYLRDPSTPSAIPLMRSSSTGHGGGAPAAQC